MTDTLCVGAGMAVMIVVPFVAGMRQARKVRFHTFVQIRDRLRLSMTGRTATGNVDGVTVSIEPRVHENEVQLLVAVESPIRVDLKLGPSGLTLFGGVDVPVGEPRFDQPVRVQGRDAFTTVALFDTATRDAVVAAIAHGAWFQQGQWRMTLQELGPDEVVRAVRALAAAHRALSAAAARRPEDALRAMADGDRHASVRLRALELLLERGVAPRALLTARLGDVDVAVRCRAATALGSDGVEALRNIVRDGSRTWRVRAARAVAGHATDGPAAREAEEALVAALDDPDLARDAAEGLAQVGTARAVEALQRVASGGPFSARGAARDALAAVRERLDPTRSGALSLAAAEPGALSDAEPGGGLALACRDAP